MPLISPAKSSQPSLSAGYAKSASESANPNLWNGLIGAWMPSLGVTGDTLRDVSGNRNHGTIDNIDPATDWVTSEKGLALYFDGVNNRVTSTSQDFAFRTGDFSVEGWAYVTSHKAWRVLATTRPNNGGFADAWHIGCGAGGDIVLYANSFDLRSAAGAVPVNTWFHWCCTRINSEGSLFVNTVVVDSGTVTRDYEKSLLGIGDFPQMTREQWSGYMSAVRIYNRGLTPTEIKQLYVDPVAPFRQRRRVIASTQVAPAFNNWYARPGRKHRIIGSGVHV